MKVMLHNPNTGDMKAIKVGWSWTLFFFAWFLSVPLFLRRLYGWAIFFILLPFACTIILNGVHFQSDEAELVAVIGSAIMQFALYVFIAAKGNEFAGRKLLRNGWKFVQPDAVEAQFAKRKWGLA